VGLLARTGSLPGPVQLVTAEVAERVGVELPRPGNPEPAGSVSGEDDGSGTTSHDLPQDAGPPSETSSDLDPARPDAPADGSAGTRVHADPYGLVPDTHRPAEPGDLGEPHAPAPAHRGSG